MSGFVTKLGLSFNTQACQCIARINHLLIDNVKFGVIFDRIFTINMAELKKPEANPNLPNQIIAHLNVPMIYANGVQIGMSATEIQLTLLTNNRPTQFIALPFPVAKAVLEGLQLALNDFEKKTKTQIAHLGDLRDQLKPTL